MKEFASASQCGLGKSRTHPPAKIHASRKRRKSWFRDPKTDGFARVDEACTGFPRFRQATTGMLDVAEFELRLFLARRHIDMTQADLTLFHNTLRLLQVLRVNRWRKATDSRIGQANAVGEILCA
jgi:hypothetical protein